MGGALTPGLIAERPKGFGYAGVFSSGLVFGDAGEWEKNHPEPLAGPAAKDGLKLFWFSTGSEDTLIGRARETVEHFKRNCFSSAFKEAEGGRTWINWQLYLDEFAPQSFQSVIARLRRRAARPRTTARCVRPSGRLEVEVGRHRARDVRRRATLFESPVGGPPSPSAQPYRRSALMLSRLASWLSLASKPRPRRSPSFRSALPEQLECRLMMAADAASTIAGAVALGPLTYTGVLKVEAVSSGQDVDMYKFSVSAGMKVSFDIDTVSNGPPGLGSYLRLFNSQGGQLAANNDRAAPGEGATGFDSYIEYTFATAGIYYIGVSNWLHTAYNPVTGVPSRLNGDDWLTGNYALVVRSLSPPDPDDQFSEAINLGAVDFVRTTRRAGTITTDYDVNMYRFFARAGQKIGFDIDTIANGPGGLGSYIRVFGAGGNELAANNDRAAPDELTTGFDSYVEYTFTQDGTYYVGVSNWQHRTYNPVTGVDAVLGSPQHLTGAYVLTLRDVTHFVTWIPEIMRNLGWRNAETLQRLWFNAASRQAGVNPLPIAGGVVTMDWILSYSRVRAVYNDLLQGFANAAGRTQLKNQLLPRFTAGGPNSIAFGNFGLSGNALHVQSMNFRSAGYLDYTLDDLTGTLGRFNFHIIPRGTATRAANGVVTVSITEVGVYVRDSFDFNDGWFLSQQLGYWGLPNRVSMNPFSGMTGVSNSSYRDFRARTGRGGDFLVQSDVKVIPLARPITFTF